TVITYILAAVVIVAIIGFVFYRLREFRKETAAAAARGQVPAGPADHAAGPGQAGRAGGRHAR
ncbi:MAG TPA: hypothetical protein VMC83_32060, partial [Streptosporangiaceae bacterium]|nr:hypothetical protein [Streptosporangiaceae bacterium]